MEAQPQVYVLVRVEAAAATRAGPLLSRKDAAENCLNGQLGADLELGVNNLPQEWRVHDVRVEDQNVFAVRAREGDLTSFAHRAPMGQYDHVRPSFCVTPENFRAPVAGSVVHHDVLEGVPFKILGHRVEMPREDMGAIVIRGAYADSHRLS